MQAHGWNILWEQSRDREDIDIQGSILTYGLSGITNTMKRQGLKETSSSYINLLPIHVSGLNLMLPKKRIHCVLDWTEQELTAHDKNILLGVRNFNGKKLLVFDTAMMVVPKDHPKRSHYLNQRRYQKLIVFDSGKWGLVCERTDEEIIISKTDVLWRKSFKKHSWLAGVLPKQNCSLIDVDRFYAKARHYSHDD
ncbi:MAG: hypothetical protein GXP14_03540 [Gammaproteobacteria bacterium]|nr:hypothetical protein [Gammaproteobacteria bacterium]